ncbi:MAG: N-acetyltransferase [Rhizobiaceae bacterium]|nr:N-acetyltransferase [Rhizobiaceae bacterium]
MSATLRPATVEDLPQITEIYAQAVLTGMASFEVIPPDLDAMQQRFDDLSRNNYPYIIAEIEGKLVGFAYSAPYRSRPAYYWSVENSVYVDPEYQGRGIGKILLLKLLDASTKAGFRQMIAVIGDSNNHGSVGLHKACGFEMVGTIKDVGRKHGLWLDTVIMQISLGDGSSTPPTDENP